MITSKPPPNLYSLPSPINMTIMTDNIQSFPLLLDPPGKPDPHTIHGPTANFGPLSRGSATNLLSTIVFDTYLMPRSPGAWAWAKTLQILNVAHFSMSLFHKYINLKEPHNQDIKEQFTIKKFWKKKTGFKWNSQPQSHSVQKVFFIFNPLLVVLTFQIIYQ